jgi:hypothetical protein
MGDLGTSSGYTTAQPNAMNDSGTIVGQCEKYSNKSDLGRRAVLWDSQGRSRELGNLGVGSLGVATSEAFSVNNLGFSTGVSRKFEAGVDLGDRAVCWDIDGRILDLNSLLPANSGWVLTQGRAISDGGWVAGIGSFDPDGAGPVSAYSRLFVMRAVSDGRLIPEPYTAGLLSLFLLFVRRRA